MSGERVLARGREVLRREGEALVALSEGLDERFVTAVQWTLDCRGRVLVTGLGKSGIVARKVAATLTATGTPALFVHPVEALHGDLGIATADDLLLAISRSGDNVEILDLVASLRMHGVRSIGLTCRPDSELARRADLALPTPIDGEACPLGLSPTTSVVAAVAMGDALAMAVLDESGFGPEDFALLHPRGALGRGLTLTVRDLMHEGDDLPLVGVGTSVRELLPVITGKRLGCACVVDATGALRGFVSDGDVRRLLGSDTDPLARTVDSFMTRSPRTVTSGVLVRDALDAMESNEPGPITQLVVVEGTRPVGVLHIHDVLRAGVRPS
ncbi:MAG TPA: KpsF/GutQ family sugar-phosphate isomerase [Candidatus Krumholzibacteria bacterium]|nr:KpsF/GutQ family sugar-phosphate isomerase [Candidatus Krumholzibacteria bacterium]